VSEIHLVVTWGSLHAFQIAIGVQTVLAQHDPRETAGGGMGLVDRQSAPPKIVHGFHPSTPEEPKQRTMGVDGEYIPLDAVGQPRQ
jgi:hypothetical protein